MFCAAGLVIGCPRGSAPQADGEAVKVQQAKALMTQAQQALSEDRFQAAGDAAQAAANLRRSDPAPFQLLFEIRRAEGNGPAAVLALKTAVELNPTLEPVLKKELAQMYETDGRFPEAIIVLKELRDQGRLNASGMSTLASLQARVGDPDGAFKTLEQVQEANPDDIEAKVSEAEALLARNDEVLATKLLDRLLDEHPDLDAARLVRARYFFQHDYPDRAYSDVSKVQGNNAYLPEVVLLKVSVLKRRNQLPEAEGVLREAISHSPKDVTLLAHLAEIQLDEHRLDDAEDTIELALSIRPSSTLGRYVRGRAAEARGDTTQAVHIYQDVLLSDPNSAPAISHLWPLFKAMGQKGDAQELLERLVARDEATIPEKVALAEMYEETHTQDAKAIKLLDDAIKREPRNPYYAQLRAKIVARVTKRRTNSVVILKTRRR